MPIATGEIRIHNPSRYRRRAAWYVALVALFAFARFAPAQEADEDPQITYLRTTVQIDTCGQTHDAAKLDELVSSIQNDWPAFDPELYGKLMLECAQTLGNNDFAIDRRKVRVSQIAVQALQTSGAAMSLDLQIELMQCVDDSDMAGTLTFPVLRTRDTRLWLQIWEEVNDTIDPLFNPDRDGPRVLTQAAPLPDLSGGPGVAEPGALAGATPDVPSASDSAANKAFKEDLARNVQEAARFVDQSRARDRRTRFVAVAEKALIALYSQPPENQTDLALYLRVNIPDAAVRKTIQDAVAKNWANPAPPATEPAP